MKAFISLLITLMLVGCSSSIDPIDPRSPIYGSWELRHFEIVVTNGKTNEVIREVPPKAMRTVTIVFEDSTCGGRAPCNLYGGRYQVFEKTRISISELLTTLVSCEWNEWEDRYYNGLLQAWYYTVSANELKLYSKDYRHALVFIRSPH